MKQEIMVSVLCTTYNHEKFIRDSLDGILQQKTDFKYEIIIHDDASSDDTVQIIQEYKEQYPDCIQLIIQTENQFQKRGKIYLEYIFPKVRGKYIAFCEGDDYWIDENKLQRQVDFLENHPKYSMCMHNAYRLNYETGEQILLDTFPNEGTHDQKQHILAGLGTDFPAFASYVLRTEYLREMPDFFYAGVIDYPIRQYYANCGKIYYFKKPMSVYRVSTPNSYMKETKKNQIFYNQYTVKMIQFFEQFDLYTKKIFHIILEKKINSDYLGFCSSVTREHGIDIAIAEKLDLEKVKMCYQLLQKDYIDATVKELCKQAEKVFIYGTSRLAMVCKEQFQFAGIQFEGFVVSDSQMRSDMVDGMKVYYLSEALEQHKNVGFVLAVQPVNADAIVEMLKERSIDNYCVPYKLSSTDCCAEGSGG